MNALIPAEVLAALGRLNAHARGRGGWGTERNAIYRYKELAALTSALAEQAELRFVSVTAKCTCDSGWFYPYGDPDYRVRCRYCSGTAQRTLRFTETTFSDGQTWHHPWEGQTSPGRQLAYAVGITLDDHGIWRNGGGIAIEWREPGDWRPRQAAVRLDLDDLVPLLNLVEDWIETLPEHCWAPGAQAYWTWKSAHGCLCQQKHRGVSGEHSHAYRLDLGKVPSGCFACASDDLDDICFGRTTPLFHWQLPVCKRHASGPEKAEHPNSPPPDALIIPPVRQWLARHERVVEAA